MYFPENCRIIEKVFIDPETRPENPKATTVNFIKKMNFEQFFNRFFLKIYPAK